MKPTMPMNAYPPGGPPGTPPGGGGSHGGWGPPPGGPPPGGPYGPPPGTPPPGYPHAPPPKKSRTGLFVGLGCGCLLMLLCIVGGLAAAFGGGLFGPGEEVASTEVVFGQPFSVTYVQDGDQRYKAWLEVDVEFTQGYHLTGNALLSENGNAFGQYTIDEDGDGSAVPERSTSTRAPWSTSSLNGDGSASGTVSLFPIPARTDGATVTVSGTISAPPGTTGTVRVIVAKRD